MSCIKYFVPYFNFVNKIEFYSPKVKIGFKIICQTKQVFCKSCFVSYFLEGMFQFKKLTNRNNDLNVII